MGVRVNGYLHRRPRGRLWRWSRVITMHRVTWINVQRETIAAAVADTTTAEPRSLGMIPNNGDALRALVKRLERPSELRFATKRDLAATSFSDFFERLQIDCVIVAPSLIPRKPGDRVVCMSTPGSIGRNVRRP
jgi:hypothetical protein